MTGLSKLLTRSKLPSDTAGGKGRTRTGLIPARVLDHCSLVLDLPIMAAGKLSTSLSLRYPSIKRGDRTRFLPAQTAEVATQNNVIKRMSKS